MTKQELIEKLSQCVEHCRKMDSLDGQAAYYGAILLLKQLDGPPQEPCDYCECGIAQEQLFQFLPPHKSYNKEIGDTIVFDEINFCPNCGRKIKQ